MLFKTAAYAHGPSAQGHGCSPEKQKPLRLRCFDSDVARRYGTVRVALDADDNVEKKTREMILVASRPHLGRRYFFVANNHDCL
jgi:hypothetical protein